MLINFLMQILLSITAPFAEIILWTFALNVRPIKLLQQVKNVLWLGVFVIMLSISIASVAGSKPDKYAPSTIVTGNSKSMADEAFSLLQGHAQFFIICSDFNSFFFFPFLLENKLAP